MLIPDEFYSIFGFINTWKPSHKYIILHYLSVWNVGWSPYHVGCIVLLVRLWCWEVIDIIVVGRFEWDVECSDVKVSSLWCQKIIDVIVIGRFKWDVDRLWKGETVNVDDFNNYVSSSKGESITNSYTIGCGVDAIIHLPACTLESLVLVASGAIGIVTWPSMVAVAAAA